MNTRLRYWQYLLTAFFVVALMACGEEKKNDKKKRELIKTNAPLFDLISATETGIDFANRLPETPQLNVLLYKYYYNGAGVAIGDLNNDGLPDLYFSGNLVKSKLYLNKGNFKFEDISQRSGTECRPGWKTGVCMVDINHDGWLDIYVCRSGKLTEPERRNELFVNQGNLTFKEEAAAYGLDDPGYGTQAAFFDYDRDGDLDMYLLNHQVQEVSSLGRDLNTLRNGSSPFAGDKLYRNEGGKFTDQTKAAGIRSNHIGFGLGVAIDDVNMDGWPDLYVSNDFLEPDYLYINQKNGRFSEQLKERIDHLPYYSMGNDIADINNDGFPDIIATDMMPADNYRQKTNMASMDQKTFERKIQEGFLYQYMYNTLQLNQGDGSFADIGKLAGVSKTDWSWATLFADFDLDGHKDLFVSNGMRKDTWDNDFRKAKEKMLSQTENPAQFVSAMLPKIGSTKMKNYCFRNRGDLTFEQVSDKWGLGQPGYSNGAAYGDLDNDGDLDLVINNIDEPAFVYRNNATQQSWGSALQLSFKGPAKNPDGIGAKIEVVTGENRQVYSQYLSRGFQSSVDRKLVIGLGEGGQPDQLIVTWPDGKTQQLEKPSISKVINIDYKKAGTQNFTQANPQPLFRDMTQAASIDWSHRENEYDDFAREVLLPHKMSVLGPAIAVADVNGDQLGDFYVGGAHGHAGTLFIQQSNGAFVQKKLELMKRDSHEDTGALFFDIDADGDQDLYLASGGNEAPAQNTRYRDRFYINMGKGEFMIDDNKIPTIKTSTQALAAHDIDDDGDLDLFVGGRQVPGKYPFPPRSYLLINEGGKLIDKTAELAPALQEIGMVTDAAWLQPDKAKAPQLLLVGEWMSPRLFTPQDGKWEDQSQKAGLTQSTGWWNRLHPIDIDGDGDLDFVAGNLGLNYKYKAGDKKPFHIYSGDLDKNGRNDIVLSFNEGGNLVPLRGRQCSSEQMPEIAQKFPTYKSFGKATLQEVYGQSLESALHYEARTFASSLFVNHGDGSYSQQPLPNAAQLSSINGIVSADFDGDGQKELLIAGNMYGSEVETPRNDAGRGLLLQSNGDTKMKTVWPHQSGFVAGGDVKNLALISTARGLCVLVVRNSGPLQLYLCVKAPKT